MNTSISAGNDNDNAATIPATTVPSSLLPEYKQGEDASFAHVQNPSTIEKVEVTLQSWKQKLEEITNRAIENLMSYVPADKKETVSNAWDSMNEAAETAVKNIKEYYTSTRVGKATIDAEQWMEKEANEAQKRVQATVASYYQQYMTSNANNSNNVGVTPLKIDLDSVPVPTFTGTVGPVTEQMKAVVEGRNISSAEDIDVEPLPNQ